MKIWKKYSIKFNMIVGKIWGSYSFTLLCENKMCISNIFFVTFWSFSEYVSKFFELFILFYFCKLELHYFEIVSKYVEYFLNWTNLSQLFSKYFKSYEHDYCCILKVLVLCDLKKCVIWITLVYQLNFMFESHVL